MLRPPFETFEAEDFESAAEEFDVAELKHDGWFCRLVFVEGHWAIYSHTDSFVDGGESVPELAGSVIYGEYLHGTQRSKSKPELYHHFKTFDASKLVGKDVTDLSLAGRRCALEEFITRVNHRLDEWCGRIKLVDQYPIAMAPELWQKLVVEGGEEGLVFKRKMGPWMDTIGRMKLRAAMDYVCMGFDESDSDTYAGWGVKSINGGLYKNGELVLTCRVSGLTAEQRADFFTNGDEYIGRVFEAEGKQLFKSGSLRHPNFVRWRDPADKSPERCVWPPK